MPRTKAHPQQWVTPRECRITAQARAAPGALSTGHVHQRCLRLRTAGARAARGTRNMGSADVM